MILAHGDTSSLTGPWYALEVSSEENIEKTMHRLAECLKPVFGDSPVQVFIPIGRRDLDVCALASADLIYIRGNDLKKMLRIRTAVTGIVGIVTTGDSNRAWDVIPIDDEYVQNLIRDAQEAFCGRSRGIRVGSFVRLVAGSLRDLCGHVEGIEAGWATVCVNLGIKRVWVKTPMLNLLNLSHVSKNRQVYFYGELVENMAHPGLVEKYTEVDRPEIDRTAPPDSRKERTATGMVRKLVGAGERQPMQIAWLVFEAIKADKIKAPKNLTIVQSIIKERLMKQVFCEEEGIQCWKDVVRKYGKEFRISPKRLALLEVVHDVPIAALPLSKPGKRRGPRVRKKLGIDKCNTCYHHRDEHKAGERYGGRCFGISDSVIHPWAEPGTSKPCTCLRFRERPKK